MTKVKSTEHILEEAVNGLLEKGRKDREEMKLILKAVTEFAREVKRVTKEDIYGLETVISDLKQKQDISLQDFKLMVEKRLGNAVLDANKKINSYEKRINGALNFLYDRVASLKDGETPDVNELVKMVTKSLKLPSYTEYNDEKLKEEIEKLKKEIKELKARPVSRGGGGISAIGVAQAFKYIAHTETPIGAINGSNTVYQVKNTIFWIAGFTLNGEQIAELPNFTYAGKNITFSTALPSAYSGKDFEIKYIGV